MKNIRNTIKYIQVIRIILISFAFSITSPVIVLAYDYTYGGDFGEYTYGGDYTYTYGGDSDEYTYGGDSDEYTYGGDSDEYTYGGDSGEYTYVPGGNYSTPEWGRVTSGSYVGGVSTYVPGGNYSTPEWGRVTSGSYVGGVSTYVPGGNYSTPEWGRVTSGSYTGGNHYVPPTSTYYPNQVLAYTDTNSNLDSVYLSDIPSTGFADYYGTLIFISILISWSAILAYIFLKRKIKSETMPAVAYINKTKINDSVNSNVANQIVSDNTDISKVEEYARMNKVLLSSDASIKLVKLFRLGKINVSDYIRSVATREWIAIGENQIK